MRKLLIAAAAGLFVSGSVLAQDTPPAPASDAAAPAPADTAAAPAAPAADASAATPAAPAADASAPAPAAPAADTSAAAPATPAADSSAPAPTADNTAPAATAASPTVDASAPAATSDDPLAGIRDVDYVSVLGNYFKSDRKRGLDVGNDVKYGAGASFIFGRHFGNGFGWEANYTETTVQTSSAGAGNFYLHQLGGDLTYSLGDRQHFTPFVLVGGGGMFDDVHPRTNGGPSGYVDAGVGLTTGTFWHNRIRLRAEVRASHDFISTPEHNGFTDFRAGLGLEIPFYELKPQHLAAAEPAVQVVKVPTGLEDSDGDGVVDAVDKCPNTPPNTRVDGDGCPIPKVVRLEGVTFEFNKTRLRPDSQTILNWVVGIMKKYPDMQVELAGYTDSVGSTAYNLKLSQKRADAVKGYLLEQGVDGSRIQTKGYGKDNPVASNDTDEGRERNRRVELHILN
ncbi:MAG TPA: OmpA family protein [Nevskia sp.]|nr:OmpA family protein [Nevskia sp.]